MRRLVSPPPPPEIHLDRARAVATVRFAGHLDGSWAAEARRLLLEAVMHADAARLLIDLRAVASLDSSIEGAVDATVAIAGDLGIAVTVHGDIPSPRPLEPPPT